eukprot:scaffold93393_cov52-Attheya_sp.AAC.1
MQQHHVRGGARKSSCLCCNNDNDDHEQGKGTASDGFSCPRRWLFFGGGDPQDEMSIATSALESFILYTFMRSFVSSLEEGIISVRVCTIKSQHQNGA